VRDRAIASRPIKQEELRYTKKPENVTIQVFAAGERSRCHSAKMNASVVLPRGSNTGIYIPSFIEIGSGVSGHGEVEI